MAGSNDEVGSRLTEGQRECLRLVMAGYKSKEIAYQLGITVDAVNKRLGGAMSTLGAPSRFVAARQLAALESQDTYHSLVSEFMAVEHHAASADPDCITGSEESDDESADSSKVEEVQAPFSPAGEGSQAPENRRSPADALRLERLVATPERVFALMFVIGAALAVLARL
jgi:DNA-binding CsgD family transcriptional regulator